MSKYGIFLPVTKRVQQDLNDCAYCLGNCVVVIFCSSLAHLEPELELFEVLGDDNDDLSHHLLPITTHM